VWPKLARALFIPALTAFTYGLLYFSGIFSVYIGLLHLIAGLFFLFWVIQAVRGVVGFWSHRAHLRFFLPFVGLVILGSSWQVVTDAPIKIWVTPPPYARLPSVPLEYNLFSRRQKVLEGSLVHVSWADVDHPVSVHFNEKEKVVELTEPHEMTTSFTVPVHGEKSAYSLVARQDWARVGLWRFETIADEPPQISLTEGIEITERKTVRIAFKAADDYGIESVLVVITPTEASGAAEQGSVEIPLLAPVTTEIATASYTDLTALPWTGVPVTIQLVAIDGAGRKGWSAPQIITLPTRSFQNPFARALIEMRQKVLSPQEPLAKEAAANLMAGLARQQSLYRGDPVLALTLRAGAMRLIINEDAQTIPAVSSLMWQAAVRLEEGKVGLARNELEQAERAMTLALIRGTTDQGAEPYLTRISRATDRYFAMLEEDRARQVPSTKDMDWPLVTAQETITPDEMHNRLVLIKDHMANGDKEEALRLLAEMQDLIENLRTTPPELTPAQAKMAEKVLVLRAIVKSQQELIDAERALVKAPRNKPKDKESFRNTLAHQVAQQKLLFTSLQELVTAAPEDVESSAKDGLTAMQHALAFLRNGDLDQAQTRQAEAQGILENLLLNLTDQMRRSLSARAASE
jgi:tetratricopeptide (TPR) repeat protein